MTIEVTPSGQACGATVRGIDLSGPLDDATIAEVRSAWLEHHVVSFPDQKMTDDDLERFTLAFGSFGDDPFIAPVPGRDHVIAVERVADETAPPLRRELAQRLELPTAPTIGHLFAFDPRTSGRRRHTLRKSARRPRRHAGLVA